MKIVQVDTFTNQPLAGNPTAVCLLPRPAEESWMRKLAYELNQPVTAFCHQQSGQFHLRWFTTSAELELCGHGTLATAYVLWEKGFRKAQEPIQLHTRSGILTAARLGSWIELEFPSDPPRPIAPPHQLVEALGVIPRYVGKTRFDYLVEVASEAELRALKPNLGLLKQLPVRGVAVTSLSANPEFDFVSRFFAPGVGVDEDAATGSAHCSLAPFWQARLKKAEFLAYQASERGGILRVRPDWERVYLSGEAVMVYRGELL